MEETPCRRVARCYACGGEWAASNSGMREGRDRIVLQGLHDGEGVRRFVHPAKRYVSPTPGVRL
jgi:hypothetical protein